MNAPRKGPRANSRAHRALDQLHQSGGRLRQVEWMKAMGWHVTAWEFERAVVGPLVRFNLVERDRMQLVLTDGGTAFLGVKPVAPVAAFEPVITPATYVAPVRPLSVRHRPTIRVLRDGAFDYRDIPSLQAGKRTEYQSSLQVDHG